MPDNLPPLPSADAPDGMPLPAINFSSPTAGTTAPGGIFASFLAAANNKPPTPVSSGTPTSSPKNFLANLPPGSLPAFIKALTPAQLLTFRKLGKPARKAVDNYVLGSTFWWASFGSQVTLSGQPIAVDSVPPLLLLQLWNLGLVQNTAPLTGVGS